MAFVISEVKRKRNARWGYFFNTYQFTLQQIILERLIQVLKLPFQMNTHTYSWIIFDKALNHLLRITLLRFLYPQVTKKLVYTIKVGTFQFILKYGLHLNQEGEC